jgi:hypothetical protein
MRTDCTIDRKQVRCPKASMLGYSKPVARLGDWVTWVWDGRQYTGRMIGRIAYAPRLTGDEKPIRGWILALMLSCELTSCCERWVSPDDVTEIHENAPDISTFLQWFASTDLAILARNDVTALRGVVGYGAAHANLATDYPDWNGDKRRAVYFAERAKRIAEHGEAARNFGLIS